MLPQEEPYSVGPSVIGVDYFDVRILWHIKYNVSIAFSKDKMPTLEDWLGSTQKKYSNIVLLRQLELKHSEILIKGDIVLRDYC